MKKLTLFLFVALLFSCKKSDSPSFLIVEAMTNGQWKVSTYKKGTADVTSGFNGYAFQFKTNLKVDAILNGSVQKTGDWTANADAKTITSNFATSSEPLSLLNGTWTIITTTWTSVDANQTVNGEVRTLRLDKL